MKTIVLDAGHGGIDPGAMYNGRKESADVLKLTLAVGKLLQAQGLNVKYTRSTDKLPFSDNIAVDLNGRVNFTNQNNVDVFVSIHRNSFTSGSANGTEVWTHTFAPPTDTALATEVLERLTKVGVQTNRGIKSGQYAVLGCNAPAIMVELGFITNVKDNELFDSKFNSYAEAIAQGVCAYLGVPYTHSNNKPQPQKPMYRVQIGAFTNEDNARNFLELVKQQGLEAYLVAPSSEKVE